MKKRFLALLICLMMLFTVTAQAAELSLGDVNAFLNSSAALGEGSKANEVAVIPYNHIDGPGAEDLFYAFVPFKYVSRNYVKYQVCYIACTCRSADLNLWSTAYVELTLPESGKIADSAVRTISFDIDSTGHYIGGSWGDSNPGPGGQTYEDFKRDNIPFYIGKTYDQIRGYDTVKDIALSDYQSGEGREGLTIDALSGATVSANGIARMLQAIFQYHATDAFFDGDPDAVELREVFAAKRENADSVAAAVSAEVQSELPDPVDTTKTYKASADATEEKPCEQGNFGPTCSAINSDNLSSYLGRTDVMYIDLRDYADYAKKHLRNFEVVPYNALIFNENASTDETFPQLYGGSPSDPIPVYAESDELLAALFPKNKTLFLMCQSGGRVNNMMKILSARGWDMSKIYNIGGMANYTASEYRGITTDTPEIIVEANYSFDALTRIAPAK